MNKIDYRRHYVLVLDTETANTARTEDGKLDTSSVLMYDCGWSIVDTKGNVYKEQSFVNRDIFVYERELMDSAYYGWKIPRYVEDLRNGKRKMASTYEIRKAMLADMELYHITEVVAHNARFDRDALDTIQPMDYQEQIQILVSLRHGNLGHHEDGAGCCSQDAYLPPFLRGKRLRDQNWSVVRKGRGFVPLHYQRPHFCGKPYWFRRCAD